MTIASYFSHRIYCEAKYPELIDLLSGYLTSKEYVVDDMGGCQTFKQSKMLRADTSASIIAAPARVFLNEYNGILFKVVHLRRQCRSGEENYSDLPWALRQKFRDCPNYVEINTIFKLYRLQVEIGKDFLSWLNSRGRKAYARSFEGEFLDIIDTAYVDAESKAEEIHRIVSEFLTKQKLDDIALHAYPPEFFTLFPRMHPDTIKVLKTAQIIESALPNLPDCSAVIIEYCKAVEIELADKILKPLRQYWLSSSQCHASVPPVPRNLHRLGKYLFRTPPKPLELGTLAEQIESAIDCLSNPVASSLIEHIKALPFTNSSPMELVRDVLHLTRNFRNPAAHKSLLPRQLIDQCREFVIGTYVKPGLLFRIIEAV